MKSKMLSIPIFAFLLVIIFFTNLCNAQNVQDFIKKGDEYLNIKYDNQKALEAYNEADKISPNNWEVYWRLSRVYVYIAEHMQAYNSTEKDAQLAVYQKAYNYADEAVKLAPNQSITYVRRAIANGRIALFKGIFSVGSIVNSVKADCDKAISIGNGGNYVQAIAHYVLALTNAKVSEKWKPARALLGLGWADIDVAIAEYKKAISLYPNFRMFYMDLARAYMREDENTLAKEMLNKVVASPKQDENDDDLLTEAKTLLKHMN